MSNVMKFSKEQSEEKIIRLIREGKGGEAIKALEEG